jgi:glycosyltransferase involved in cell wall biosynthesis
MLKADLHVHTKYSANPADMLLKRFGTQESYTEVEEVYRQAKARGMDFVTVTDHNVIAGALRLVELYPKEAFTGVELTTCFPEDGCAIHVLVYDFTPGQFADMDRLRSDIYVLRDYLRREKLPCSVAHATYSVNGKLTLAHVEKLLVLFDVFECVNGTRVGTYNDLWKRILRSLTPQRTDELRHRHVLETFSDTPWVKGYTGGSDEHAGLFVGSTFTLAEGGTKEDFLRTLRMKRTDSGGRSNHYKTQVFTFLKIAYESSQVNRRRGRVNLWNDLCAVIFDGKTPGWKIRLKLQQMRRSRKEKDRAVARQVIELVAGLTQDPPPPIDERIDAIYNTMAAIEDAFFILNAEAFREAFGKRDVVKIMSALTALFRSIFLSMPFLGTFRHLHQSSVIMDEVRQEFLGPLKAEERKVLWFTDTLNDLNGVSMTLRNFSEESARRGRVVRVVSVAEEGRAPHNYQLELPVLYEYTPDFYPSYTLRFPSLLKSIELIFAEKPTEIVVSTPGPVGLIGILTARLFGISCRSIYHSDFTRMTELGLSGGTLASFVQGYVRWFYSCTDEILVPTQESLRSLAVRGYEFSKLGIFRRGIDTALFAPAREERGSLRPRFGLDGAFTLLYVGRVSKDKSIGFLIDIYRELRRQGEEINLIICGDGPELERLRKEFDGDERLKFTGRVAREDLPTVYSLSDLFVFPSTIDTFGMAVLEAQACGLPALVTNIGGPQEVIDSDETGYVLPVGDRDVWIDAVLKFRDMAVRDSKGFGKVRDAARRRVREQFSWDEAIEAFFDVKVPAVCPVCGSEGGH